MSIDWDDPDAVFMAISKATAVLHSSVQSRFYSTILVPATRALRVETDDGEIQIIGHPAYWRRIREHPDVRVAHDARLDPFDIPVIDLDTDPARRRRVLEPIFTKALEPA